MKHGDGWKIKPNIDDILPKGPYPSCLCMADRALLAGYPWYGTSQELNTRLPFFIPCSGLESINFTHNHQGCFTDAGTWIWVTASQVSTKTWSYTILYLSKTPWGAFTPTRENARSARADPARGLVVVCRNCVVLFTPPRARSASAAGPLRAPARIAHGAILLRVPQDCGALIGEYL